MDYTQSNGFLAHAASPAYKMGYDIFYTEPGAAQQKHCRVCGSLCEVQHSVRGATSWSMVMSGGSRIHDRFSCSSVSEQWHKHALRLVQAIDATPSKRVAALMQEDLRELLMENNVSVQ